MPEIAEWIKKIIAILVLAGFLEMLLPNNELKGVTKMMMGLLVILILIQPVFKIFKFPAIILDTAPALAEVDTAGNNGPATGRIIKAGLAVRDGWTAELRQRHRELLVEKLKTGVELIEGVKLLKLEPEFKDPGVTGVFGFTGPSGYIRLEKIRLRVRLTNPEANAPASLMMKRREMNRRIRDTIQLISNLTDDRIEVNWDD